MLLENEGDIATMALILAAKEAGHVTREGMSSLIGEFSDRTPTMDEIASRAEELGLKPADSSNLMAIVEKVVESRIDFVKERGMGAMGPLMGVVMKECGGAADGKQVSALLREVIMRRMLDAPFSHLSSAVVVIAKHSSSEESRLTNRVEHRFR